MKKLLISAAFVAGLLISSGSTSSAASNSEQEYGFILSCGKTIYHAFSHTLSKDELLFWTDYYEEKYCGGCTSFEPMPDC